MGQIAKLWDAFQQALAQDNTAQIDKLKKEILKIPPKDKEDVERKFNLALYLLQDESTASLGFLAFAEISGADIPCLQTQQARIAFAMALRAQNKKALGIFELRKVLSAEPQPSVIRAMALDYLSLFLREDGEDEAHLREIDNQRIETLEALAKGKHKHEDLTQFKLLLATALEERAQGGDLEKAIKLHEEILKDPQKVSKKSFSAAKEALRRMSARRRK